MLWAHIALTLDYHSLTICLSQLNQERNTFCKKQVTTDVVVSLSSMVFSTSSWFGWYPLVNQDVCIPWKNKRFESSCCSVALHQPPLIRACSLYVNARVLIPHFLKDNLVISWLFCIIPIIRECLILITIVIKSLPSCVNSIPV